MFNFSKIELGIMNISKYIVEATAYDKKLMLERPLDSLPSSHKRVNFAFETLFAEYFARAKVEFVESDFDSLGLVAGISPERSEHCEAMSLEGCGLLTKAGALLADKSPIRHSRVSCTHWHREAAVP